MTVDRDIDAGRAVNLTELAQDALDEVRGYQLVPHRLQLNLVVRDGQWLVDRCAVYVQERPDNTVTLNEISFRSLGELSAKMKVKQAEARLAAAARAVAKVDLI